MYEITGTYGLKMTNGRVVRMPSAFKMHVNTPEGVKRFLEDMAPIQEFEVKDLATNKKVTKEFKGC